MHAAGELVGRGVAKSLQADYVQPFLDLVCGFGPVGVFHAQAKVNILGHGQPFEQRALLKHHAAVHPRPVYFVAVDEQLPAGGPQEAGDDVQQGGFTAARRAEHREEAALLEGETDVLEGVDAFTVSHAEHHVHIVGDQVTHADCPVIFPKIMKSARAKMPTAPVAES